MKQIRTFSDMTPIPITGSADRAAEDARLATGLGMRWMDDAFLELGKLRRSAGHVSRIGLRHLEIGQDGWIVGRWEVRRNEVLYRGAGNWGTEPATRLTSREAVVLSLVRQVGGAPA